MKFDGFAVDGDKHNSVGIFMSWAKKDTSVLCKQINEEIKTLKRDDKTSLREAKADAKKESEDTSDALFATMSEEFEKTHTKIINDSVFVKQFEDKVIVMSKKELMTSYEHIQCGVNSNNINPVSFIQK
jgi:vacuolar-type H+-ATPase subunit E/Vma4